MDSTKQNSSVVSEVLLTYILHFDGHFKNVWEKDNVGIHIVTLIGAEIFVQYFFVQLFAYSISALRPTTFVSVFIHRKNSHHCSSFDRFGHGCFPSEDQRMNISNHI
jgi:hypothetical protein